MYEEPYRWIEAVANRRTYLDDQFAQGNPLIGLSFQDGILLLTSHRGTPKLYEIYDRIALGGMGHPADLEKLRFSLLDMAHVEGFQRSPADVTASRLMKNGLSPTIKQAFEEIFKAPYIAKILLAEVGSNQDRDHLFSINYDGMFEEQRGLAVLSARGDIRDKLLPEWKEHEPIMSLESAVRVGVRLWGLCHLMQSADFSDLEEDSTDAPAKPSVPDENTLMTRIQETLGMETLECVLLSREQVHREAYRSLPSEEIYALLPQEFQSTS